MERKDNILKLAVPMDTLRKSNGFGMDMGGSLIKLVYLDKDEWENHGGIIDEKTGRGTLYVTSFPRENVDEVLAFIRENVYIRRSPDLTPVIHTTGVGLNTLADRFNSYLNVRFENTFEFDDFMLSAKYFLENFKQSDVIVTPPEEAFKEGTRVGKAVAEGIAMMISNANTKLRINSKHKQELVQYFDEALSGNAQISENPQTKITYPILVCQMGSGFAIMKVFEDGSYDWLDITPIAGRTFLDLGRVLTGAKTFEELVAFAESGHENNLNVRATDVVDPVDGDAYSGAAQMEMVIYSFGKTHGKDIEDIGKADLARTLLQTICSNIMNVAHHMMHQENVQHLFLMGSFTQPDLMRRLLVKEFEVARGFHVYRPSIENKLHIFTFSGCMGALGSFLTGCGISSKK